MKQTELRTFYIENILKKRIDIYKMIRCAVGEEYASDLTQNVLKKSWQNISQLADRDKCWPWVKSIIHNEISDHIRENQKYRKYFSDVSFEEALNLGMIDDHTAIMESDVLRLIEHAEETAMIMECLSYLDERDQAVIRLHLISDISLKDISESTGIKYGTVRVIYSRALRKLKSEYIRMYKGDSEK